MILKYSESTYNFSALMIVNIILLIATVHWIPV